MPLRPAQNPPAPPGVPSARVGRPRRRAALVVVVAGVMALALAQPATAGPAAGHRAQAADGIHDHARSAPVGHYAALGDSYSSGLGIPAETNVNCGRSDHNYPTMVAAAVRASQVTDVTCAGADTTHMTGRQDSAPPQLDALRADTALVTLGIGGNDLDLPGVITRCVLLGYVNSQGAPCKSSYTLLGTDEIRSRINATAPKIAAVLQEIRARSPQAKVLLVGYPVIFPDDGSACRETIPLAVGDFAWLRDKTRQFNAMLAQQAAVHGATYIDTYGPSVGHDACKPAGVRWIEPEDTASAAGFHPNEAGHRGTADAVLAAVNR